MLWMVLLAATLLGFEAQAEAKSLEEILMEKGVITEADYREATKKNHLAYYKPGKGITVESQDGNYSANLGSRLQVLYAYTDNDDSTKDDTSDFKVNRMKLWLSGHVFTPKLKYKFQQGWGKGKTKTEDAFFSYKFATPLTLKAGQFKPGQARQELTSSAKQLFVERSLANDTFNLGRDIGIQASGSCAKHMVEYRLGFFNGNGPNISNPDNHHMVAGRLDFNPLGKFSMEGPSFSEKKPLLNIGLSYAYNKVSANDVGSDFDTDNDVLDKALNLDALDAAAFSAAYGDDLEAQLYTANVHFKVAGLSLGGEYYMMNADPDQGGDWDADGYYLQAGYQVIPNTLEVAARFSAIDSDSSDATTTVSEEFDKAETQLGVNYYFKKHNAKLQADYTVVEDDLNADGDDQIFRLLAQVIF